MSLGPRRLPRCRHQLGRRRRRSGIQRKMFFFDLLIYCFLYAETELNILGRNTCYNITADFRGNKSFGYPKILDLRRIGLCQNIIHSHLKGIKKKKLQEFNLLTVTSVCVMPFFPLGHNNIPAALRDFLRPGVRGWLLEDGVFFEAQDGLDAVDGGWVGSRALHGACGRRDALIHHHHHHHLGCRSEQPHRSVKVQRLPQNSRTPTFPLKRCLPSPVLFCHLKKVASLCCYGASFLMVFKVVLVRDTPPTARHVTEGRPAPFRGATVPGTSSNPPSTHQNSIPPHPIPSKVHQCASKPTYINLKTIFPLLQMSCSCQCVVEKKTGERLSPQTTKS